MTRVKKVYGDGTQSAQQMNNELTALGKNFAALSSRYGVAQADVINLAADWAAAGSSGIALAKATKLTIETMILGEMDAKSATQALIAIQAQYGLAVDDNKKGTIDLTKVIALLNNVENQTGTSLQDLITVMSKSAGAARDAGIDVLHLAAFTAALVPAAGTAANAGNALKTIITRLIAPSKAASGVLKEMGINTESLAWQNKNGTDRLLLMASAFQKLSSNQKDFVSKQVAGVYQISRFDVLMRALVTNSSYYNKALKAGSNEAANYAQAQRELNMVLDSSPQKLKIIGATLQNSLASVIQPLLPTIIMLANTVAAAVRAFSNLSPQVQHFVLIGLLVLAMIGPVTRYIGSLATLIGILAEAILFIVASPFKLLIGVFKIIVPYLRALWVGLQLLAGPIMFAGKAFLALGGAMLSIIKTAIAPLISAVASMGLSLLKMVGPALLGFATMVWSAVASAGAAIAAFATEVLGAGLVSAVRTVMTYVGVMFLEGFAKIGRIFAVGMSALETIMLKGMYLIEGAWTFLFSGLQTIALAGMYLLEGAFATGGAGILAIIKALGLGMRAAWISIWAAMASITETGVLIQKVIVMGGSIVQYLATLGPVILEALSSPWVWAGAAIVAALVWIISQVKSGGGALGKFFSDIWTHVKSAFAPMVGFFNQAGADIAKAFHALPQSIQNAMMQVIKIVAWAGQEVYKLFSYLNPFAHHSPSLVEVVTWGMAEIKSQYASVANIGSAFKKAAADLAAFKKQMGGAGLNTDGFGDNAKEIAKYYPALLPGFNALRADLANLNKLLDSQKSKVDAQQKVVDAWAAKLDKANAALDAQQKILDGLQNNLDALQSQYSADQQAVSDFANAPIQGMKQFTDEIFANSEAQKKIQLQMLQWQDANGSITDISNKMQSLAGDMEKLRGESKSLQQAGAGSDVLNPINGQIDQMQAAYDKLQKTGQNSPMAALQAQLDALQNQGQELQLMSDIKFDPLTKQIQDLANAQKELPFDQIIAGIQSEQADMAKLAPQIDAATAAVNRQKAVVAAATAARDAIQARYDAESKSLDLLKNQYDQINNAIQDVTNSLQAMSSAASNASSKAGSAAGSALPPGANFPDVGGSGGLGREGAGLDQSKQIDDLTKQLSDQAGKALGGFGDMFEPIKKGWNATWGWIKTNVGPVMGDLGKAIGAGFQGIGTLFGDAGHSVIAQRFQNGVKDVMHIVEGIFNGAMKIIQLFMPQIKQFVQIVIDFFKRLWTEVGPTVVKFMNQIKPLAELIGVILLGAIKVLAAVFTNVLQPVLDFVIRTFDNVLSVIGGVIDFIKNVFTGNWAAAWGDIEQVFGAVWDEVSAIFNDTIGVIVGVVEGFVKGIVGFFQWLYDVLVGHSIIPDLMNAIIWWFNFIITPIKVAWNAVWTAIKAVWNAVVVPLFDGFKAYFKAWAAIFGWIYTNVIKPAWDVLWGGLKSVWNSVGVPFINGVKAVISGIGDVFTGLKKVVSDAWNAVWTAIKYTWDHLGKGIFQGIADGFVTIVNAAIHAINAIIHGINGVSSLLHLGFSIGTIDTVPTPTFAQGGYIPQTRVGGGFRTNGARAIVGEGGQYPEYVIPTDPRYRKRARMLWAQTGSAIQMLSRGGSTDGSSGTQGPGSTTANTNYPRGNISNAQVIADIKKAQDYNTHVWSNSRSVAEQIGDDVMGALKVIGGVVAETGMKAIMIPVKLAADTFFSHVPIDFIKKTGLAFDKEMYNKLTNLAKGKDSPLSTDPVKRFSPVAGEAVLKLHFGNDQNSGNMKRALKDAAANVPDVLARLSKESGGDPNAINNWDSNAAAGHPSKGLMQVIDPTYQAYKGPFGSGSIWDPRANMFAGLNYAQHRYGSIMAGMNQPGGYFMGGILPAFENGGIAKQATAGVFGEAGHEVLAPLAPLWKRFDQLDSKVDSLYGSKSGGDTTIIVSGTLSFPNIKSGDDAGEFIDNLKGLAGK